MGCASLSVAFVVVLAATVANVAGFNRKNTKAALKVYMAAEAAGGLVKNNTKKHRGGEAVATVDDFADMGPIDNMWNVKGPTLYTRMALDGSGHRLYQILLGLAVAVENRMKYRILCTTPAECRRIEESVVQGGVNFKGLLNGLFGDVVGNRIVETTCHFEQCNGFSHAVDKLRCILPINQSKGCRLTVDADKVGDVSSHRAGMHATDATLLRRPNTINDYYNRLPLRLMAAMREQLLKNPVPFKKGKPSVALHMRRGDVGCAPGRKELTSESFTEQFRLVPDEAWIEFITELRKLMPDPDIHAYSATSGFLKGGRGAPTWKGGPQRGGARGCWEDQDFDVLRGNGITMHLDENDLLPLLTAWQRALVFAHSLSHLSEIASYTSAYCVIGVKEKKGGTSRYTHFREKAKMNYFFEWRPKATLSPEAQEIQQGRLKECIAHALKMVGGSWDNDH